MNRNSLLALLVIGCGIFLLLHMLGIGFGWFEGILFPIGLIVLGWFGLKNGRTMLGWILIAIGVILLLDNLSGFIGWIIAIVLIVIGYSLLKRKTV
jgi:hypothetical protein